MTCFASTVSKSRIRTAAIQPLQQLLDACLRKRTRDRGLQFRELRFLLDLDRCLLVTPLPIPCHPEATCLSSPKDLGAPREASALFADALPARLARLHSGAGDGNRTRDQQLGRL